MNSPVVLRPSDWRFNLLQVCVADARLHLMLVVDLLVRVLGLAERAASILAQAIHELYRQFGVWDGNRAAFPHLFHLHDWVLKHPELNSPARQSILDRLGALLTMLTPACAAVTFGWSPSTLSAWPIIFEMRSASEAVKELLVTALVFGKFHAEIEGGVGRSLLRLFILIEDGQRIALSREGVGRAMPPLAELAGVVRGGCLGLGLNVQSLIEVARLWTANMATKGMGRLGAHEDYERLGADMGMDAEQIAWAWLNLKPGRFILQVSDGDHREPVPIAVPEVPIGELVSDAEVAASARALDRLPVIRDAAFDRWTAFHSVEVTTVTTTAETAPTPPTGAPFVLNEPETRLLRLILENPGQSVSHYNRACRMNGRRAAACRARLVGLGLVREHNTAINKLGRTATLLEPTQAAAEALRRATGGMA